jgi:transcriptional regulator with XRE-family HTH domain
VTESETPHDLARRARLASGLSQAGFGRLLGVATATVSAWEQDRRQPTPRRMAHALLRLIAERPEWCVEVLGPPKRRERAKTSRVSGVEAEVLGSCRELARGSASRVPLDRLRAVLPHVERELLDEVILRLEGAKRIALSAPLFPDQLSAQERTALLNHPNAGLVLFVDVAV